MRLATAALAGLACLLPVLALRAVNEQGMMWLRDRCLWVLAACGLVAVAPLAPWAVPVCAVVLLRWRTVQALPSVVTWAAIVGAYLLVGAFGPRELGGLAIGWALAGSAQGALVLWQFLRPVRFRPLSPSDHRPLRLAVGTLQQRTFAGACLALCLPFTVALPWWAAIPCAAVMLSGLLATSSWLALLALYVGLAAYWPASLLVTVPLCGLACALGRNFWDHYSHRGTSLDSLWERGRSWSIMAHHAAQWPTWLTGAGPGQAVWDLLRWNARYHVTLTTGHAHNEWLESWYEHGLAFVVSLALLGWHLWPRLATGDPWTACVVTGAVLASGTTSVRVASLGALWWVAVSVIGGRA